VKPGESVNYIFRMVGEQPSDPAEPDNFLAACGMTCCTNGDRQQVDVLKDSSMLFVNAESNARWEAGEFGHPPKTKGNQNRDAFNSDDNHEAAAFGLSSFGALPSFVNAHLRADTVFVTKIPDLDVVTVHWTAEADNSGSAQQATNGFSIIAQQASLTLPNLAGLQHQCPVRLCVKAPSSLTHDFKSQPLCMVPVTVTARNYSTTKRLRVSFDALIPDNTTSEWQATTTKGVSSNFIWAGLSNFAMESLLEPLESRSSTLQACFHNPGMYNLNSIRTIVSDDVTGATLHSFVLQGTQCIINVQSA